MVEMGRTPQSRVNGAVFLSILTALMVVLFFGSVSYAPAERSGPEGEKRTPAAGERQPEVEETREERLARLTAHAQKVRANELGEVPIFAYHRIGDEEGRWTRTPEGFRKDLEELYRRGYVLVPLRDYLSGDMDLPAGKSPAVITFDDSTPGHFRLISDNAGQPAQGETGEGGAETPSGPVVDPECAVGILRDFAAEHPEFGHYATFFVNAYPFSGEPGQRDFWKQKLQMLAEWGFEIGNHTMHHAYLKDLTEEEIRKEIALLHKHVREAVPGYKPSSIAIVQDGRPERQELLLHGSFEGVEYDHLGVILWAWRSAESPFSTRFDPLNIQRIQVFNDKGGSTLSMWLDRLEARRYISDGDSSTVAYPEPWKDTFKGAAEKEAVQYSTTETERAPAAEQQAADVKGVHVTFSWASSQERWNNVIALVEKAGLNCIELDAKDESGRLGYLSGVQLARDIGAAKDMMPIREMLAGLRDRGIYSVARIVVFRDPVLAAQKKEYMVRATNGTPIAGGSWVNPYSKDVWDYNVSLAEECYELGFDEVQFDYIRFPEGRLSLTVDYPGAEGRNKVDTIAQFLEYARSRLGWERRLSAAVFGFIGYAKDDLGIGQRPERMAPYLDYMSPMVYPSHYSPGNYDFHNPNAHPYEVVDQSLKDFQELLNPSGCRLRPWLQGFTLGPPAYGRTEIRAQIDATHANDINTWLLWNAGCKYRVDEIIP